MDYNPLAFFTMIELNTTYIHYKNHKFYTTLNFCKIQENKIWVNAVAPGGIQTPGVAAMQGGGPTNPEMIKAFMAKIPMHRMGEPDEIGKVALFLAGDMSSYMTGEQIVVDGGALLS